MGSYYLTLTKDGEPGEGKVFRDFEEALMAYDAKVVSLHSKIKVRRTLQIGDETVSKIIDTTAVSYTHLDVYKRQGKSC